MASPLLRPMPPSNPLPRTAATPGPDPGTSAMRPVPPPTVAQGTPGRPPAPRPSPPAGSTPPVFGAAPAPPVEAPRATPPTPGAPPAGAPATQQPSLSSAPAAPTPAAAQLTRVPTDAEFAALGPGATVQTPWGQVVADDQGKPKLVLDEAGRAAYTAAKSRAIQSYGVLPGFAQTPGAPPAPIEVGRPNFNPFTGQWSGEGQQ